MIEQLKEFFVELWHWRDRRQKYWKTILQKKWRSLHLLELLDGCSTIGESSRVNITTIIVIVTTIIVIVTTIIVIVTMVMMVEIMSMLLVS